MSTEFLCQHDHRSVHVGSWASLGSDRFIPTRMYDLVPMVTGTNFVFLDNCLYRADEAGVRLDYLTSGRYPLLLAWFEYVWRASCREVRTRYCFDARGLFPRGHIVFSNYSMSMLQLFRHMHSDTDESRRVVGELYVELFQLSFTRAASRSAGDTLESIP